MRVEGLEDRALLAAFVVNTDLDNPSAGPGDTDGLISLREAITASNTNLPFGDALAGEGGGVVDQITFAESMTDETIVLGGVELTVSGDLSITGLGSDKLTISGNNAGGVFWIEPDATVDISQVTIADGDQSYGGGIYNEGILTVSGSLLTNNSADWEGGAVCNDADYNEDATLTLIDTVVSGNSSGDAGGGVWNTGKLTITNSTFTANSTLGYGGAIDNFWGGTVTITGSTFEENTAGSQGGAIRNYSYHPTVRGSLDIAGSTFTGNSAGVGGVLWSNLPTQISDSTFSGNSASFAGGGIFTNSTELSITDSTIENNDSNRYGGGISVWSGTLEVSGCTFSGNSAAQEGGAIENSGATVTIADSTIADNSSGGEGGGVRNDGTLEVANTSFSGNSTLSVGGGIWNRGSVVVKDSDFSNNSTVRRNTSGNGGAIGNTHSGTVTVSGSTFTGNAAGTGGAIDNFRGYFGALSTLDITDSTFSANESANSGGAIWNDNVLSIAGSTISGNTGGTFGGGVHTRVDTSVKITGSTISNNSARYGGGVDIWGGAVEISHSTISGNSSVLEGGGIENWVGALKVTNSTLSGNSTEGQGGGIYNYGTLEVTNATIVFNRADADGNGSGNGGGLYNLPSTSYSSPLVNNTILAGNRLGAAGGDSPEDISGTVDPAGSHNLIGDAATAGGLVHGAGGNIVGNAGSGTIDIATVLDPNLANNGGPTRTHALVAGSLALNAGDNTKAVDADGNPLAYDQRDEGFARIYAGTVDIGAFEAQNLFVEIDVKPGSDPNAINLESNGLIAVAIFTTEDFDASQVNASTVLFAGAGAVHSALEDVDGDGDLDMVLHFKVEDTTLAALYEELLADDVEGDGILDSNRQALAVSLFGETVDGEKIVGTDEVDLFFSGKALRELLDQLALAGVL